MRILMVNRSIFRVPPESSGGGAERHGYLLANHLAKLGHEVFFVSKTRVGAEFDPLVRVRQVPPRRGVIPPQTGFFGWVMKHVFGNILSLIVALRALASERFVFHVVHCHGALAALLLSLLIGRRIPVVYTMHDASPWLVHYPGLHRRVLRKLAYLLVDIPCLRSASHVIAVCPLLRAEAMRLGVSPSKVTFVPSGIQMRSLPKESVGGNRRPGLFVGQLVRRKRVDLILSAMGRLPDRNIRLVVLGDGPERRSLVRLSEQLGVSDRVLFTGFVDDRTLARYYAGASYFALPSSAEALPLVLLEAMSYSLPIVAGRADVYVGILSHGENALLFEPGNASDLANCLEQLILDPELRVKLARNAFLSVKGQLWDEVAKRVLSIYDEVSSRKRS